MTMRVRVLAVLAATMSLAEAMTQGKQTEKDSL